MTGNRQGSYRQILSSLGKIWTPRGWLNWENSRWKMRPILKEIALPKMIADTRKLLDELEEKIKS